MNDTTSTQAELAPAQARLKKPLSPTLARAVLGAFSLLLVAALLWLSRSRVSNEPAVVPSAGRAVVSQGWENDAAPTPQPSAGTHDQKIRQETLQTMKDKAAGSSFER